MPAVNVHPSLQTLPPVKVSESMFWRVNMAGTARSDWLAEKVLLHSMEVLE
jgi:hypothetical protein